MATNECPQHSQGNSEKTMGSGNLSRPNPYCEHAFPPSPGLDLQRSMSQSGALGFDSNVATA